MSRSQNQESDTSKSAEKQSSTLASCVIAMNGLVVAVVGEAVRAPGIAVTGYIETLVGLAKFSVNELRRPKSTKSLEVKPETNYH